MKGIFLLLALLFSFAASAQQFSISLATESQKQIKLDTTATVSVTFEKADQGYIAAQIPTEAFEPHYERIRSYQMFVVVKDSKFVKMVLVTNRRAQMPTEVPWLENDPERIMIFLVSYRYGNPRFYMADGKIIEIHLK